MRHKSGGGKTSLEFPLFPRLKNGATRPKILSLQDVIDGGSRAHRPHKSVFYAESRCASVAPKSPLNAAKGSARDIFSPRRNAAKGKRPFCLRYRVHTLPLSSNGGLYFPTWFRTFPRSPPAGNRKSGFLCFPSDLPSFSPPLKTRRFLQSPWNILYRPSL